MVKFTWCVAFSEAMLKNAFLPEGTSFTARVFAWKIGTRILSLVLAKTFRSESIYCNFLGRRNAHEDNSILHIERFRLESRSFHYVYIPLQRTTKFAFFSHFPRLSNAKLKEFFPFVSARSRSHFPSLPRYRIFYLIFHINLISWPFLIISHAIELALIKISNFKVIQ